MNKRAKSKVLTLKDVQAFGFGEHAQRIAEGYALGKTSRVWMRRDGRRTIRLVYRLRNPKPHQMATITYVMKGVA